MPDIKLTVEGLADYDQHEFARQIHNHLRGEYTVREVTFTNTLRITRWDDVDRDYPQIDGVWSHTPLPEEA